MKVILRWLSPAYREAEETVREQKAELNAVRQRVSVVLGEKAAAERGAEAVTNDLARSEAESLSLRVQNETLIQHLEDALKRIREVEAEAAEEQQLHDENALTLQLENEGLASEIGRLKAKPAKKKKSK